MSAASTGPSRVSDLVHTYKARQPVVGTDLDCGESIFAGIALTGATLRNDTDENQELYGRRLHSKEILLQDIKPPDEAQPLISALNRYSRFEEKNKPIESRAADAVDSQADRPKVKPKK